MNSIGKQNELYLQYKELAKELVKCKGTKYMIIYFKSSNLKLYYVDDKTFKVDNEIAHIFQDIHHLISVSIIFSVGAELLEFDGLPKQMQEKQELKKRISIWSVYQNIREMFHLRKDLQIIVLDETVIVNQYTNKQLFIDDIMMTINESGSFYFDFGNKIVDGKYTENGFIDIKYVMSQPFNEIIDEIITVSQNRYNISFRQQ